MRVLLFTEHYLNDEVGGAQKSVQILAEGLQRKGVDVAVCAVRDAPGLEITEHLGVRIYRVPLLEQYRQLRDQHLGRARALLAFLRESFLTGVPHEVSEVLAQEQPDIVHTNILSGFSHYLWQKCRERRVRIVHTVRDYGLVCARSTKFKHGQQCVGICLECRLLSLPKKHQTRYVDAVVGISRMILDDHLRDGLFAEASEARVIPNPIGLQPAAPVLSQLDGHRPPLQEHAPIRLGFIGRLVASKGIELLLQEMAGLPDGAFTLFVAGVGDKGYVAKLKAAAGANVVFLDRVEAAAFYPTIDLLIVPSLWNEPFGRVVVEAFAFGVPVLGSNRGALPELIEPARTGQLFDPAQAGDLQQKILEIFHDPRAYGQMRQAALDAAFPFADAAVAEAYANLYRDVLADTPAEAVPA
jgi:glycosyltransferase involved in cell wall biosynthesis